MANSTARLPDQLSQWMIQSDIKFDGVFSGDDESAVGVINALNEAGMRIPEDVAVVGFDDQRMAPYLTPPLTTVRSPNRGSWARSNERAAPDHQEPRILFRDYFTTDRDGHPAFVRLPIIPVIN